MYIYICDIHIHVCITYIYTYGLHVIQNILHLYTHITYMSHPPNSIKQSSMHMHGFTLVFYKNILYIISLHIKCYIVPHITHYFDTAN